MKGWLTFPNCILEDNLAWAKVASAPVHPAPYLPMILLGFNKEKYMNRLEKDEAASDAVVAPINEAAKLAEEVAKTTAKEVGKDVAQDPPLKL